MARGFADLASKVPLVGGLMGALGHGILDLSDAIGSTSERLSAYNGELAMQLANREVQLMQLDIRRAQQFGPQLMAANEARFRFQDKMNAFMDKYTPLFLAVAEKLLDMIGSLMDLPGTIYRGMAEQTANMFEIANQMLPGNVFAQIIAQLRLIAANTAQPLDDDGATTDTITNALLSMRGLRYFTEQAPAPGSGLNPNLGAPAFAA